MFCTESMENNQVLALPVVAFLLFQEVTVSQVWPGVTLNLQEALHHLPYPREERRKGSVPHRGDVCTDDETQRSTFVLFLQRTRATQIIPCTVSQLMSASQADEAFRVGDVEVAQVC